MRIKSEIKDYIESEILPQYKKLSGHTDEHIAQVIRRSLKIAEDLDDVDINMVYVVAAYHDLGRLVDDDTHQIESGKMMRADKKLREFFLEEQIETMAQAVEDHRASLRGEPRNVYGKIVSSADRDTDVEEMIIRSYDYTKLRNPEITDEDAMEDSRKHLREKYTPDGYGAKKVYFPTEETIKCFETIERLTRDSVEYAKLVKELDGKRKPGSY